MAVFTYRAVDSDGSERQGTIDAVNIDIAIAGLQRRGLVISSIDPEKKVNSFNFQLFETIRNDDIVILSRQITTLFEAQVSALRAFQLLAGEARTPLLGAKLSAVASDIQSGATISTALSRHPAVFSSFYVSMVRAGEESGKLDEVFSFLADYLDRNYEITQKAKNALVYPIFVLVTFSVVMGLMMTLVIPKLAEMLNEAGQDIPVYTRIVVGISTFLTHYILLFGLLLIVGGIVLYRFLSTERGRELFSRARLQMPAVGDIYRKLFLSRIADNLSTMLKSGVQVLRGLEITSEVVGDPVYEKLLREVALDVKGGLPVSEAMRKHPEIPGIVDVMMKIGEETGNMSKVLETMARYYRREVNNAVDTLVGLIEPLMIVVLALGVGLLLAAVLIPIYSVAAGF